VGAQEWFADTRYHNDLAIALMGGLPVDESATTALATLLGVATGGLTSVLATWLLHRTQARAQRLEQDALRRQDLCNECNETAARCYVHALQHEEADIPGLVDLHAKDRQDAHPVFGQGR
jgi:hypothetical protein